MRKKRKEIRHDIFYLSNIMCQNKSNLNTNVYPLGIIDRDQKFIPTYSRTKKVRRLFTSTASISSISTNLPSSSIDMNSSSHYQKCSPANCDYFMNLKKNEPSDFCDKEMSTEQNMDQSSYILTHSVDRFHHNDEDRNTRIGGNIQSNIHLENTHFNNMINSSSSGKQFHSYKTENATHRHRTMKKITHTSKFCVN